MKILHIIPAYLPAYRYGGPVECVHSWNAALVRAGHEVTVFTTDNNGGERLDVPTNTPVMKDGVRIFYFRSTFPRSWFYSRELCRALATRIKEFDVVHITSVFLSASAFGAHYAKKFKKPYIISPHGSLMQKPLSMSGFKKRVYIALVERRNLRGAAAIHFTVPREEREYRDAEFPFKKAFIIPNSIANVARASKEAITLFRKEFEIPDNNQIVLFLGRISPIKGLDTLISAFSMVSEKISDAVLVIVGGDERGYKSKIERLVHERGLSTRVVFTGMQTGEKKMAAYGSADALVMPSVSESFGMSAAEAMHAGVPVILTEGVGISEFVSSAHAGIIVKNTSKDVARAIIELLQNGDERKALGRVGAEFVEKEFSEASVAKKFSDAYRQIVEDTKHA